MRESGGYSLLEVMVAIVILTVCMIPMVGMFDAAAKNGGGTTRHELVRAETGAAIEYAVALGYDRAVNLYPPGETRPCPDEPDEPDEPEDGPACTVESAFVDEDLQPMGDLPSGRLLLDVEVESNDGSPGSSYSQSVLLVDYAP